MGTEYFYGGKQYSLDPVSNQINPYGTPTGYNTSFKNLSTALDPRTANQLNEVSQALNTGIRNIEVGPVGPDVFESIPKEHFKEMNRMAKIAGAELSLHAPMIDPTGITQQGWNKMLQETAEKQLWNAIETSHELNPKGAVVTIHATSGFPAPSELKIKDENGKERTVAMTVVNRSSGKVGQIGEEERYWGSKEGKEGDRKPIPFNPQAELDKINDNAWMSRISNVNFSAQRGQAQISEAGQLLEDNRFINATEKQLKELKEADENLFELEKQKVEMAKRELKHGKLFLKEAYNNTRELYDDVYRNASSDEKKKLEAYAEKVTPYISDFEKIGEDPKKLKEFADAIEQGLDIMGKMKPKSYEKIRDFAIEKAAETTANLALKSFNKFGSNAPIIALENHPANQGLLTTGDELRDTVNKSRELFIQKAKASGMSESEAKKQAEKLIGVTWDVGHINMLRKYGYGKKELIEQTEAIAPFVKKVHLADNFGMEHTELPMGMGNVPLKEMMDKIGKEGYDVKKVIEAGNWWQHFSQGTKANHPLIASLSNMGVPVYSGAYTAGMPVQDPNFGYAGGYFSGYGTMLPDQNFQMYGAGFSTLPMELGGQIQNKDSRFSGTPMS